MTLMRYCGFPIGPITGNRVAVHDTGAVARRDDRVLVEKFRLTRRDQFLIFGLDRFGAGLRHNVSGDLAEHRCAVDAEIFLGGTIDQQVSQVRNVLHDDRRRNVLDDRIEKRAGMFQFALGPLALGDVFVRGHPAAAFGRLIDDGDDATVLQFDVEREGLALLERRAQFGFVARRIEREMFPPRCARQANRGPCSRAKFGSDRCCTWPGNARSRP